MRSLRGSLARSVALLATMAVLWSGHLCALGEGSAALADGPHGSASHGVVADSHPADHDDDADCDSCGDHGQPSCPHASVCCVTWAMASSTTPPGPILKAPSSSFLTLFIGATAGNLHSVLDRSARRIDAFESPPASPAVLGPVSNRAPPLFS